MTFGTVAILGPGLIGGSLTLGLLERKLADRLIIYSRSPQALDEIRKSGAKAELTVDASAAVREADVVILCVPIEVMSDLVRTIRDALKPTALVTDVGSVKGSVMRELEPLLEGCALWIGSHPMAGSERTGFAAARADLFAGAPVVITPSARTTQAVIDRAAEFWSALGGRVTEMEPDAHDLAVAEISHIPHLIASLLVGKVTNEGRAIAGSGFRDTTRVASGSPELWTEILWANRKAIALHLRAWKNLLANLEGEIFTSTGPGPAKSELRKVLQDAQVIRAEMVAANPTFSKRP